MDILPFIFSRVPKIIFGTGRYNELFNIIESMGNNVLLVTGSTSLKASGKLDLLTDKLANSAINYHIINVKSEPSPDFIDDVVYNFSNLNINLVVSIGGGSVIDAGKAISAMIFQKDSVCDYLEGVGKGSVHTGKKAPFIAVPTTAGTGSETTKNAVLSRIGEKGFKKSLRHDNFVPDIALVDPELMVICPQNITASSGLDAFTQLLGSYVSTNSSPMTDSLALKGLHYVKESLIPVCTTGATDISYRSRMAYAAMISGITLANAGLGIVHGLASVIGGFFDIPHGIICGTLVGEAIKVNIHSLFNEGRGIYLTKYARLGALLSEKNDEKDIEKCCNLLISSVESWIENLKIPKLGNYGVKEGDINRIVEATGNKNNPVDLSKQQIKDILLKRL